jgi:hypothetical protein
VKGLRDRRRDHCPSPSQATRAICAAIEALRKRRHPGAQIAVEAGVSPAIVSHILKRLGLNRLSALEPAKPVRRYERAAPPHRHQEAGQIRAGAPAGNFFIWRSTTMASTAWRHRC